MGIILCKAGRGFNWPVNRKMRRHLEEHDLTKALRLSEKRSQTNRSPFRLPRSRTRPIWIRTCLSLREPHGDGLQNLRASLAWLGHKAAAAHFIVSACDQGNGFGVGNVLLGKDALGQRMRVVCGKDWHKALQDDDAVIQVFVHEMHGAAGDLYPIVEGLGLRVQAGERRQKGRVDVEDATGEGRDELGRKQTHVAGQANEIDAVGCQAGDDLGIVLSAGSAFGDKQLMR